MFKKDQLDSGTYQTFEMDNFKYEEYEKAVLCALIMNKELLKKGNTGGGEDSVIRIGLLGAGRGPLIRCIINAVGKAVIIRNWIVESLNLQKQEKMEKKNENDEITAQKLLDNTAERVEMWVKNIFPSFSISNYTLPEDFHSTSTLSSSSSLSFPYLINPLNHSMVKIIAVEKNPDAFTVLFIITNIFFNILRVFLIWMELNGKKGK
jgi:hypothetical protein